MTRGTIWYKIIKPRKADLDSFDGRNIRATDGVEMKMIERRNCGQADWSSSMVEAVLRSQHSRRETERITFWIAEEKREEEKRILPHRRFSVVFISNPT